MDLSMKEAMDKFLPPKVQDLVHRTGGLADSLGFRVYLVGGFVRDLLLKVPNLDLDLVVIGDGLVFARALAESLQADLCCHERFGTATLRLNDGLKIDVASARKEFYEYPAALPRVEAGSLRQDLYRRDFTINAMAIALNQDHLGQLVDFFCGRTDLEKGIIRVLYNLSFIEDPARIMRAVRFEKRYGFCIESKTLQFIREAVKKRLVGKLTFHRIWEELRLIFNEDKPYRMLKRLKQLGAWEQILPEVRISQRMQALMEEALKVINSYPVFFSCLDKPLLFLLILFEGLSSAQLDMINARFQWPLKYQEAMVKAVERKNSVKKVCRLKDEPVGRLHRLLQDVPMEVIVLFILICGEKGALIHKYLEARRSTTREINGRDLIALGWNPGPEIGKILNEVWEARLNGFLTSREEEIAFVKGLNKK